MTEESAAPAEEPRGRAESPRSTPHGLTLIGILLVATGLRLWSLGSLSFWYDEVVTLRLASAPGPSALIGLLEEIDATRAPLHPLLLQGWLRLFGPSEASARSLSALFGIATVACVYWIARMSLDRSAGLWAAWLTAVSPLLVYYAREARMYALLVLLTTLCWALLLSPRPSIGNPSRWKLIAYALGLAALLYTHPLGLLMAAALMLASITAPARYFGTRTRWLAVHLVAFLLVAPWIAHYFDHAPEFSTGRLPIKYLLGTPIGFVGGNGLVLLILVAVAVFGLVRRFVGRPVSGVDASLGLILWLVVPPTLLYLYSWIGTPIFGPSRYTLFVAPAYLILVAQGLSRLPMAGKVPIGLLILLLSAQSLCTTVFAPGLKADWRAFGRSLATRMVRDPSAAITVLVRSADPSRNVEVETARYYLPEDCRVRPAELALSVGASASGLDEPRYLAVGIKEESAKPPAQSLDGWVLDQHFPGLAVYRPHGP